MEAGSLQSPEGRDLMDRAVAERYNGLLQKLYCLRSALFAIHSQVADEPASWVVTVQNSLSLVFPHCAIYITLPPSGPVGNNVFTDRMVKIVKRTMACKQLVVDNADEDEETGELSNDSEGGHCLCAPIKDAQDAACGVVLVCSATSAFEMDDEEFMLLLSDQINLSFQWLQRDQDYMRLQRAENASQNRPTEAVDMDDSRANGTPLDLLKSSSTSRSGPAEVPFIGTPLLRRSKTTPASRDTTGSSRRCISNVRANTTYDSHLSHLLHSSAAGVSSTSLRSSQVSVARHSTKAAPPSDSKSKTPMPANSSGVRSTKTAARSPDLRLSDFLSPERVADDSREEQNDSQRKHTSPWHGTTRNTPNTSRQNIAVATPTSSGADAAPTAASAEGRRKSAGGRGSRNITSTGSQPLQPDPLAEPADASTGRVEGDFSSGAQKENDASQDSNARSSTSPHSKSARMSIDEGANNVAIRAGASRGRKCTQCSTVRRRAKLLEQRWQLEKEDLEQKLAEFSTESNRWQLKNGVPQQDHDSDFVIGTSNVGGTFARALEACLYGGKCFSSQSHEPTLTSALEDDGIESQLFAFRKFLATVRAWSSKLGFPSVRVYRIIGCDENAGAAVKTTATQAQFYEITASPQTECEEDADVLGRQPVRWDGLVGDAINILRQSGQHRLRYQRHVFFPIRATKNGAHFQVSNDGALRAILRIEDTSLLGHGIRRRRQLFERWLYFVKQHAATVLSLLGDGAGASSPSTNANALQYPIPQPKLQIRAHKRVFEFAKAALQLAPRVASQGVAQALRRLSEHVLELASNMGIASTVGDVNGAHIVVWWLSRRGKLWTNSWHPAFPTQNNVTASRGSSNDKEKLTSASSQVSRRLKRAYARQISEWAANVVKGSKRTHVAFRGNPCFEYGTDVITVGHFIGEHRAGSSLAGIVEMVIPAHMAQQKSNRLWWKNMLQFLTYVSGVLSAWCAHFGQDRSTVAHGE